ncbi:MAG: aldo/keto reductase [Firmicutes bacterium]|nr:aldo/keto reductase [Bacillota bacterium]
MTYRELGKTGLNVSRLILGTLTMGPFQANLDLEQGADLIRRAVELGVNMLDTAEVYRTYPYIKRALRGTGDEVMVATKSFAYTWEDMKRSLDRARIGVDRDVIDVFLLHEQESARTLEGHRRAFDYLLDAKVRGIVRAAGVSTHFVEVAAVVAEMPEVDVLHPIINREGLGVQGGTLDEMMAAVGKAHDAGKGVYAMKALGGGNLLKDVEKNLGWVRDLEFVDAIAVGAVTAAEIEMDAFIIEGRDVPESVRRAVAKRAKRLFIEEWCKGCGACVKACQFGALSVVGGAARVDPSRCVLCGYCAATCPGFHIKVV